MSNIMSLLIHNTSKLNRILTHNAQMWNRVLIIRHLILLGILIMTVIGLIFVHNYKKYNHKHKFAYNKNLTGYFIVLMIPIFLFLALIVPCIQGITYPLITSNNGELVQNSGYLSVKITDDDDNNHTRNTWMRIAHESNYMDNASKHKLIKLRKEVKTLRYQKLQDKHYLIHYYRSNNKSQKHYYHIKYQQGHWKYKMIHKGIKPDIRTLYFCAYQNKAPNIVL